MAAELWNHIRAGMDEPICGGLILAKQRRRYRIICAAASAYTIRVQLGPNSRRDESRSDSVIRAGPQASCRASPPHTFSHSGYLANQALRS